MIDEEYSKTLAINEKVSTVILLFLLLLRLADQYLPVWIFRNSIPDWYPNWHAGITYILTVMIVWLNRHRLASLNIDRPFVLFLVIGGWFYLFYLRPDVGIPVAITAAFVYWAYRNNYLVLKNKVEYPLEAMLLVFTSILLPLLSIVLFDLTIKKAINLQLFLVIPLSILRAQLGAIVFEEVIFRGALWAYLRHLNLKEPIIFLAQAFLFWIAHNRFLLIEHGVYSFWVYAPLASLLLGFIVWRSKSLTLSTIAHVLLNSTARFINDLF